MALIFCNECDNEISQKAKSCPKCGAPQKKSNRMLILIIVLITISGGYFYWKFHDNKTERIAAATEILKNNRDDILGLASSPVKNTALRTAINIVGDVCTDCIIDSLAVRLADKYSLDKLNDLKTKPERNIIEVTKLITDNPDVCRNCLLFKK